MVDYCKFYKDEYLDYMVYSTLAEAEGSAEFRRILRRLAEQEKRHYEFWSKYAPGCRLRFLGLRTAFYRLLRLLFGLTFVIKFLEKHEEETINEYKSIRGTLRTEEDNRILETIIREEEDHEKSLINSIEEPIVKYTGFIVLGLADAIIEINGVHAGFLGVTNLTLMAGIAGLIVGFSAAISMAVAAYLQSKHVEGMDPTKAALLTGVGYTLIVVLLATPYFIVHEMMTAFALSIALAVASIASFSYYTSVLLEKRFLTEFLESTLLMLGVSFGAFLIGEFLGRVFGIKVQSL